MNPNYSLNTPRIKIHFLILSVYLFSIAIEGPIRYALSKLGASNFLYLRDLSVTIVIIDYIILILRNQLPILSPITVFLYILSIHFLIALMQGSTLFSALFGLKIYWTILFGLVVATSIKEHENLLYKTIALILVISITGIILSKYMGSMPWEGLAYQSSFGTSEIGKIWWTNGEKRPPGFARASYDAAMIVGISGCYLITSLQTKFWLKILLAAISSVAIYLTTTKGMLMAFMIFILWYTLTPQNIWKRRLGLTIVTSLLFLCIAMPIVVVGLNLGNSSINSIPTVFMSLWDRFTYMWPLGFSMLHAPQDWIFGQGLGGIGTPRLYENGLGANFGDNFFVYQYVIFGAFIFPYLGYLIFTLTKSTLQQPKFSSWFISFFILLFGYGITGNMLEEQFMSIMLGLTLGMMLVHQTEFRTKKSNSMT